METKNENLLQGISIKNTTSGFTIELNGPLYKKIGDNLNTGKVTKAFYHELKEFIESIKDLA